MTDTTDGDRGAPATSAVCRHCENQIHPIPVEEVPSPRGGFRSNEQRQAHVDGIRADVGDTVWITTESRRYTCASASIYHEPRAAYGDRRMSFTMQPCGRNGRPINGGNHYANANTLDAAREYAHGILALPHYFGYQIESVEINGGMYEFRGTAWASLHGTEGQRHYEVVRRPENPDTQ